MKGKLTSSGIYTSYMIILSVWIGTQLVSVIAAPNLEIVPLLLGGGGSAGVFLCFFLTRGKQRLIPTVLVAAVLISGIYFSGWQKFFSQIKEYTGWLWGKETTLADSNSYEFVNICLLGIIFLLYALIMERFFLLKELTAIGLLVYLLYCMINHGQLHKVTVCLIVLFILSCMVELFQKKENGRRIIAYLLPFLLLYFAGNMTLPEKADPYEWGIVKEWYKGAEKTVIRLMQKAGSLWDGKGDFGLQFTGFSEKGLIGGSLNDNKKEVMELNLTQGRKMNIYLTGNVFDTFNGEEWTAKEETTEYDHTLDLLETMYAVKRYAPANTEDYLFQAKAEIYYTGMNSKFLFTPQKTKKVLPKNQWSSYPKEQGGQWTFSRKQGFGTNYEVLFYQMNLGHSVFGEMVEAESKYRYDEGDPENVLKDYKLFFSADIPSERITEENLIARQEKIKRQYIQTYEVSEEVQHFIEAITANCRSDYEKCRAIEQTLLGQNGISYTYVTSPGMTPDNEEFLDYFLLESREGYCTYYATAFVIMVRELGIPARYVQGYCVSAKKMGEETVTVTSSMAHAWPEVYFEGVGWIPFEPTPGYGSGRYISWKPAHPVIVDSNKISAYQPDELPAAMGMFTPAAIPESEEDPSGESTGSLWFIMVLIVILAVAAGSGLLIASEHLLWKHRYKRYTPEEKMNEHVKGNLRILRFMGYGLEQGETVSELRKRILQADEEIPLQFIPVFERVHYGNAGVDEEMIAAVWQEKKQLLSKIKGAGKWKYFRIRVKMLLAEGVGYER